MRRGRRPHPDILTPREWEVLALVRAGLTNEQIAERLGISLSGARYHVSEILSKLAVGTRGEAADWLTEQEALRASVRRTPAVVALLRALPGRLVGGDARRLVTAGVLGTAVIAFVVLALAVVLTRDREPAPPEESQAAEPTPTPPELGLVDFSQTTLGPRFVTVWDLPETEIPITPPADASPVVTPRPLRATDATGIEAALSTVIKATLAGNPGAVEQAGAAFGVATLHDATQQPQDRPFCGGTEDLCITTVPLAPANNGGEYWAVVTGGKAVVRSGSPLGETALAGGSVTAFAHFVAVYERYGDGSWSDELARADLVNATADCCYLVGVSWNSSGVAFSGVDEALASGDAAWQRLSATMKTAGLSTTGLEIPSRSMTSLPRTTAGGTPTGWLVLSGTPYMATGASIFYVLHFEPELHSLKIVEAKSDRQWGGGLLDVDGDGVPEVIVNQGNACIFSCAAGVDEAKFQLLHWRDDELVDVPFEVPAGLPENVAAQVEEVLRLVNADLWTDAASQIADAVSLAPGNDDLRWLARRIQLITVARLLQVERQKEAESSPGRTVPTFLMPTLMMAGEYESVVDLMRQYQPGEVFDPARMRIGSKAQPFNPDYPFANMTGLNGDLVMDYTGRALEVMPERAAVYAVRALGLAMAWPADLTAAQDAMAQAARLAPDDPFYAASLQWLEVHNAGDN